MEKKFTLGQGLERDFNKSKRSLGEKRKSSCSLKLRYGQF